MTRRTERTLNLTKIQTNQNHRDAISLVREDYAKAGLMTLEDKIFYLESTGQQTIADLLKRRDYRHGNED